MLNKKYTKPVILWSLLFTAAVMLLFLIPPLIQSIKTAAMAEAAAAETNTRMSARLKEEIDEAIAENNGILAALNTYTRNDMDKSIFLNELASISTKSGVSLTKFTEITAQSVTNIETTPPPRGVITTESFGITLAGSYSGLVNAINALEGLGVGHSITQMTLISDGISDMFSVITKGTLLDKLSDKRFMSANKPDGLNNSDTGSLSFVIEFIYYGNEGG